MSQHWVVSGPIVQVGTPVAMSPWSGDVTRIQAQARGGRSLSPVDTPISPTPLRHLAVSLFTTGLSSHLLIRTYSKVNLPSSREHLTESIDKLDRNLTANILLLKKRDFICSTFYKHIGNVYSWWRVGIRFRRSTWR